MRKSRFSEEQIVRIIQEYAAGAKVSELCRKHGMSDATFYKERLYREERLTLRRRNRKKIPKGVREGAWCPIAANQRWSLDFTMDALANGRKFRTVNLKDDCTRECPAIDVALSIPGSRVVEMLERVARERGYPDVLTVDNGPELRGRALDGWADDHGVQRRCCMDQTIVASRPYP